MRPKAFSLVEVIVAIAVLAVGILSILGSMAYASRHRGDRGQSIRAAELGRRVLELCRERNLPFADPIHERQPVPLAAPPFEHDIPPHTGFRRVLRTRQVGPNLARVTLELRWRQGGSPRRLSLETMERRP